VNLLAVVDFIMHLSLFVVNDIVLFVVNVLFFRKRTPKRMSSIKRDLDARVRSDAFRYI
jgi:hypothetical protein